ncbi:MAG: hypothetical protein ACOYN3_04925 [Acidimicrobiia bacterium]
MSYDQRTDPRHARGASALLVPTTNPPLAPTTALRIAEFDDIERLIHHARTRLVTDLVQPSPPTATPWMEVFGIHALRATTSETDADECEDHNAPSARGSWITRVRTQLQEPQYAASVSEFVAQSKQHRAAILTRRHELGGAVVTVPRQCPRSLYVVLAQLCARTAQTQAAQQMVNPAELRALECFRVDRHPVRSMAEVAAVIAAVEISRLRELLALHWTAPLRHLGVSLIDLREPEIAIQPFLAPLSKLVQSIGASRTAAPMPQRRTIDLSLPATPGLQVLTQSPTSPRSLASSPAPNNALAGVPSPDEPVRSEPVRSEPVRSEPVRSDSILGANVESLATQGRANRTVNRLLDPSIPQLNPRQNGLTPREPEPREPVRSEPVRSKSPDGTPATTQVRVIPAIVVSTLPERSGTAATNSGRATKRPRPATPASERAATRTPLTVSNEQDDAERRILFAAATASTGQLSKSSDPEAPFWVVMKCENGRITLTVDRSFGNADSIGRVEIIDLSTGMPVSNSLNNTDAGTDLAAAFAHTGLYQVRVYNSTGSQFDMFNVPVHVVRDLWPRTTDPTAITVPHSSIAQQSDLGRSALARAL